MSPQHYAIALLAALCIGLAKAGFSGISLISVFLLADLYGAKPSVGLALPLLIAADLLAYPAFRKHGSWRQVWPLLGPALAGMAGAWCLLDAMGDQLARKVIGGLILIMVAVQVARKSHPEWFDRWAQARAYGLGVGVFGGFATMLANAAGPVLQLYLLARRVPKMELLGIAARFFLLINILKLPLNAKLALITPDSLLDNAKLLPAVVVGVFGGRWLIQHVSQKLFEWMIVAFAIIAGVRLTCF